MKMVVFENSFEGFLSAVFDVYEYKFSDVRMTVTEADSGSLFSDAHFVTTDVQKSERVWKGLKQKISATAQLLLYRAFLSEQKDMPDTMLAYIRYVFSSKTIMESDYSHPAVLTVTQTAKKVYREKHRMEAFVRFQLTSDQLFYAIVDPDFNVLPLLIKHFKARYADQRWLIYDSRRHYGIYYDLYSVETVEISFNEGSTSGKYLGKIYDEKETLYQDLWKQYFSSVNITSRKNMPLHIRHMPKRYWKNLTEKM